MNRKYTRPQSVHSLGSWLFVGMAAIAIPLQASTVLELDFQNYNSGSMTTTATQAAPGANSALTLSDGGTTGNVSINTSASTGISTGNSALTSGYFSSTSTPDRIGALITSPPSGTGEYRDYFGSTNGWGSGTVAVVYRPSFDGQAPSNRAYLMTNGFASGTSNVAMALLVDNDETVRINLRQGNSSPAPLVVRSSVISWSSSTWYFIAFSWESDQNANVYVRPITESSVGEFVTSDTTLVATTSMSRPLYIGNNYSDTDLSMVGDMSYFIASDQYTSSGAGFDSLYDSIVTPVPEPSSILFALGGASSLLFFQHRKKA